MKRVKKGIRGLTKYISLTLILTIILSSFEFAYAIGPNIIRLWGQDRFETGKAISEQGWQASDYVVLATGEGDDKFPDALAGAPLAKALEAPTLLTTINTLETNTENEIRRIGAKKVFILGGTSVVSQNVEVYLRDSMGLEVERLWGQDRYATAVEIARKLRTLRQSDRAILTTGEMFQYAMMAAPGAAREGYSILFTGTDSLNPETEQAIGELGITNIDIIGNNDIISQQVTNRLSELGVAFRRIEGMDMEQTNINVINHFWPGITNASVARNDIFADALTGASFAAKENIPIILLDRFSITDALVNFIKSQILTEVYVFGGTGAIPDESLDVFTWQSLPPFISYEIGNTAPNILNQGYARLKDDYYYYINVTDGNKLYRIKSDGTGQEKIFDKKVEDINVYGDRIYFINKDDNDAIYATSLDGQTGTRLNYADASDLFLVNGFIYYTTADKIYRMGMDGSGKTELVSNVSGCMNVTKDWLYYSGKIFIPQGYMFGIYKVRADGSDSNPVLVTAGIPSLMNIEHNWSSYAISISPDWVYFADSRDSNKLYKIKSDGTGKEKLSDDSVSCINVSGGWIYYSNDSDGGKLYKVDTNGSNKIILNNISSSNINVTGGRVYYTARVIVGTYPVISFANRLFYISTTGGSPTMVN